MSSTVSNEFVIQDVRIFTGEHFIDKGYVHVRNGKISAVGQGEPPSGLATSVLSKPGHTLIPGLIDGHIHTHGDNSGLQQALRFGVTTCMDMHGEPQHIENLRNSAKDLAGSSDFKYCGSALTIPGGWPEPVVLAHGDNPESRALIASWPKIKNASEAAECVGVQVASGATYIKLMQECGNVMGKDFPVASPEIQKAGIAAAHKHGIPCVAHALSYKDTIAALEYGVDGLTHCFMDKPTDERYVELYKKNNAHVGPSLAVLGSCTGEGQALQKSFGEHPLAQKHLNEPPGTLLLCDCLRMAHDQASTKYAYEAVKKLYAAGIPIIVGSDSAGPAKGTAFGLSVHHEMWLLVHEIGMKPVDVLKSATSLTAKRFNYSDRGVIETGRLADLVLVEGDIEKFFEDRNNLVMPLKGVWRNGVAANAWAESA